jgi:PAS domain S-box-containing protein
MNSFGFFSLLAGALQLSIPPYALRLVRRFGAQRVGWFVVLAFACLGLLHLLEPLKTRVSAGSSITLDAIYAIGSVLLLIGMAHVETMVSTRLQAAREEKSLHRKLEQQIQERTVALTEANKELTQEIARRAEREKALQDSETRYRLLFTQNPQPMWIVDLRSLRFLAVNRTALSEYGFSEEEFMALGAKSLVSADGFLQDLAQPCFGVQCRGRWPLRKKDGAILDVEIMAMDLKYGDCPARLVLANDITARQRHERQLLETQKMELIGKVASGVAHHFNNILAVITGHTELLLKGSTGEDSARQLNQVAAATNRGACFTRQLLAAGGQQILNLEPLSLNDSLQRMNPMLRRLLGDSIALENSLAPGLLPVLADARTVENIVLNLVLNARDAMSGKGTLTLNTKAVWISETEARRKVHARAGEFVRLRVCDTGYGMSSEVQARLFEPFFTTKDIGQAAGLGLASAYGLARQQSGWIECISELGKGTEVHVFLPCAPRSSLAVRASTDVVKPVACGTVLFVEPDDRARALGRFFLNRHGYVVIEADSAALALSLWESEHAKIDLLLTETSLPGEMSGPQLAECLRSAKPALKVMYAHNSESDEQPPSLSESQSIVAKPYTAEGLVKKVEQYLVA